MGIGEATLALCIDGKCTDAIELMGLLTLLGFQQQEAHDASFDAVKTGLVQYAS